MNSEERIDTAHRVIGASTETIYAAFADPAAWEQWLPPTGMTGKIDAFDFREGGRYRLTLVYARRSGAGKTAADLDVVEGTFIELVPDKRVVQEVAFTSDDPAFAGTMLMTWSLETCKDGTRVTITADNVPAGISPGDHIAGFQSTLDNLARFAELTEGA